MRRNSWLQVALTAVVMFLLLLAGVVMMAHQARHHGNEVDCPVCLQGHPHGPFSIWSATPIDSPPPLTTLHLQSQRMPVSESHGFSPLGRAPPPA